MNQNLLHNGQFYYQVGNHSTLSKNEAFLLAQGDSSKISFFQQNNIWDNVDFSQEPSESFDQLCDENCRIFRDKYNHLCLWLSAGYDSQTALDSFIRSGVALDEIAFMDRSDYYHDPELPFIEHSAKIYKEFHNPKVKINRVKIGLQYHQNFYNKFADSIWYLGPGSNLRYTKSTANYIHNFHEEFVKSKLDKKTRADIYGKDKPKLDLRNNQWFLQSNDLVYFDIVGAPVECFYCNSHLPKLHVKQIHMQIQFFESFANLSHDLVHQIQSNDSNYYQAWNLAIGRTPVHCIEAKDSSVKNNFANHFTSFDSTKLLEFLTKTNSKTINTIDGYRKDFLKDIGNPTINLHQIIFGQDWFIKNRSAYFK
jgi:hypothetical protein